MRFFLLFIIAFWSSSYQCQNNTNCANMSGICTNTGITFQANSGVPDASTSNPGNNYGCLFSSPNPAWYYLEISQSGSLSMTLSAAQDIDFINSARQDTEGGWDYAYTLGDSADASYGETETYRCFTQFNFASADWDFITNTPEFGFECLVSTEEAPCPDEEKNYNIGERITATYRKIVLKSKFNKSIMSPVFTLWELFIFLSLIFTFPFFKLFSINP